MRRVVSVCLPTWPTDRIRRRDLGLATADTPLVAARHDGSQQVLHGADAAARRVGLRPGQTLALAQARIAGLVIVPADPAGDDAALAELAAWALRYTPLTAADPPDGLWLDIAGCATLHGGEAALLGDLGARLRRAGFAARIALADTPGAAHALARYAAPPLTIVPQGAHAAAIAALPVAALRIAPDAEALLRRLGLGRIADIDALPRGPLRRRLGAAVLRRLDQALGRADEPIEPATPTDAVRARAAFAEPIATAESIAAVIARLVPTVCAGLEARGAGARQLELVCERIDGVAQVTRAGTARPIRAAAHLTRLLTDRIATIDPGLGIEAMTLIVTACDPLGYAQPISGLLAGEADKGDGVAMLVDTLANRLGEARVWRAAPVSTYVPERSVARVGPLAAPPGDMRGDMRAWRWPRPPRLLRPPQPIEAIALLPDDPPVQFTWRRQRIRVHRADGPERIRGEWWRHKAETHAIRDYFRVEDERGCRYWLFRRGNAHDAATGDGTWFVHGIG